MSVYDDAAEDISPQKGDDVSVCYDGKWGRAVKGKVLQRRGFALLVEFQECDGENILHAWFVRTSPRTFGAYAKVKDSLMRNLFGLKGDWYNVMSIKVFDLMNQKD